MQIGKRAVLSVLRRMSREQMAALPDVSEGIENRLYQAVRKSCGIEELYEQIKTKRYPLSRVRRLVLSAFLQIPSQMHKQVPPYLRVLAMNEKGNGFFPAAAIMRGFAKISKNRGTCKNRSLRVIVFN